MCLNYSRISDFSPSGAWRVIAPGVYREGELAVELVEGGERRHRRAGLTPLRLAASGAFQVFAEALKRSRLCFED